VTGNGFVPYSTVRTELVNPQGAIQIVDTLDVERDGRLVSNFDLANNTAPGTYSVQVREIGDDALNPVQIDIVAAAHVINNLPATIPATLQAGTEDWYVYTPSENQSVRIQTTGSTDTVCELRSGSNLYAENDDGGESYNCLIDYDLSANTAYRIKVRHYLNAGTGAYALSVVVQ
jgi:hypothetical protein